MLEKTHNYWKDRYESIADPIVAPRHRVCERLNYDVRFIKQYTHASQSVLDLGSGPAILANEIAPMVKSVLCVENQSIKWEQAVKHPNIRGVTKDIVDFAIDDNFDLILLFGVVNYLTVKQTERLYKNVANMMSADSVFIVKSQFAKAKDVYIDNFSEELGCHYQAVYRSIANEKKLLNNSFHCTISDIYPDHINKYPNTHHYHLICKKK